MRLVRLEFSKTGKAIYISHLDLMRLMARALRRAKIPLWYTEGFNPHPYMMFAAPLSLGQAAEHEYMDIKIQDEMTDVEIMQRMNDNIPDGVKILSVGEAVNDHKAITASNYNITLTFNSAKAAESFCSQSRAKISEGTLTAEKPSKKGRHKIMKEILLSEYIYSCNFSYNNKNVTADAVLATGSPSNLNPNLLIDSLENCVELYDEQRYIVRKNLLMQNDKIFC